MTSRRNPYFIIFVAIIAAYAPAIHSGFCRIDDPLLLRSLHEITDWDIFRHFFPGNDSGLYFRPLLMLTYIFDLFLWGASPLVMHLENVLLHLFNSMLVFEMTRLLLPSVGSRSSHLPLLTALLFGLHPLNVESVSWISGRTDLLCASFIFLCGIATLKFKHEGTPRYLIAAVITLFLGFLTKEVAIAFLPGAALILFARNADSKTSGKRNVLIKSALVLVGVVALVFLYYFVRDHAFSSDSSRIGITLSVIFNDLHYALFVCLRAFGFYLKKIFLPFPLNFAIIEVDPLYELLAMPLVLFCFWLLTRRTLRSSLFLAGLCLVTPAFLIAFGQVAWAQYAERYLYLPLGFILPVLVCYLGQKISTAWPDKINTAAIACVVLLLCLGSAVFYRAYVWRSDLRLLADTTNKSPLFKQGWNEYGVALYKTGELEKALASFEQATSLRGVGHKAIYDTNRAVVLEELGRDDEAIDLLRMVINKQRGAERIDSAGLISLLEKKIDRIHDENEKKLLLQEINGYKGRSVK